MLKAGKGGKMVLGGLLLITGLLILTGADKRLETYLVDRSPQWLIGLSSLVASRQQSFFYVAKTGHSRSAPFPGVIEGAVRLQRI